MKKLALAGLVLFACAFSVSADPLPYDSAVVKELMHSNIDQVGAIKKAAAAGDFTAVGNSFIVLAQNAEKALTYAPPKGSAADWSKIWNDFLTVSFKGVGAAGAKDAAQVEADVGLLMKDRGAGHSEFK